MTPREKKIQELAIEEAKNLKKHAFKTELKRLEFYNLETRNNEKCIYGQMTGNCYNPRAATLLGKCAKRSYATTYNTHLEDSRLNGIMATWHKRENTQGTTYHSPIELFILQDRNVENGNNEILINFLKGETKTLKFV